MSKHRDDKSHGVGPGRRNNGLPPSPPRPFFSGGRGMASRILPIAVAFLILLVAFLDSYPPARSSLVGVAAPRQAVTVSLDPEPTVGIPGAVPKSCPRGAKLESIPTSSILVARVHGLHVWLVGFSGPHATMHYADITPRTARGWPYTLILYAAADVTNPITISARAVDNSGETKTVWFSRSDVEHATLTLTLDPRTAPAASDGTTEWPMTVVIPSSGCYYLDVQYKNHETGIYFAAGF